MSKQTYTLPSCLLEGAKLVFPTLDFSRVHFYIDDEGTKSSTYAYLGRTEIVFRGELIDESPCEAEWFRVVCHELVHALQAQGFWALIRHRAARWTCIFMHGGKSREDAAEGNCVEKEAYDFSNAEETALLSPGGQSPCLCFGGGTGAANWVNTKMLPMKNPGFAGFVAARPWMVKSSAGCSPWDCLDGPIAHVFGFFVVLATYILSIAMTLTVGPISEGAAIVGMAIGIGVGASFGVLGAIGGAVAGALIGAFLGAIIEWIVRLFGDSGGSLNIMFTNDNAVTWHDKVSFDRSTEPMALAFGLKSVPSNQPPPASSTKHVDRLSIAWTGLDSQVNLLTASQSVTERTAFEWSEDCGPALCNPGVRVHIVWQGTDNQLNVQTTYDGIGLLGKTTLGTESPDDASPAICHTGAWYVLTYIGTDQQINLLTSPSGISEWGHKLTLGDTASEDSTVAVTPLGAEAVMIAWTGEDDHINVMELAIGLDGSLTPVFKNTLDHRSSDEAGPALASHGAMVFLAWTGSDGQLNFMMTENRGHDFVGHQVFEQSREDCGPALSVHEDGTICIGWVGTDE